MARIIVNFEDDVPPNAALAAVGCVVAKGRISADDTAYCYATAFRGGLLAGLVVVAEKRKASDSFRVYREAKP